MFNKVLVTVVCVLVSLVVNIGVGLADGGYQFERLWPRLPQPWYFQAPSAVAVDSSGFVYVTDANNSRVQKFTSDGIFIGKLGISVYGGGVWGISGITVDSLGNVYVSDTSISSKILKFSPFGQFITNLGGL
uniref:NHL repeat containing protein n=1 Tax=uncultured Nitrospirae bacterium MY4-5C TaxID=798580 RepID=D9MP71_9BACT|nr:NHL repeat containing protein [uncultured Nitrospirae bacterium MY4-5C]